MKYVEDIKSLVIKVKTNRVSFNAVARTILNIGVEPGNDIVRKAAYDYDIAVRDLLEYVEKDIEILENNL